MKRLGEILAEVLIPLAHAAPFEFVEETGEILPSKRKRSAKVRPRVARTISTDGAQIRRRIRRMARREE